MAILPRVCLYGRPELGRFRSLAEGCKASGLHPFWQRANHFRPEETITSAIAVVVDGLGREGRPVAAAYRRAGVPVWVLELPRIRSERAAWALLLDSLHWLPEGISGRPSADFPKLTGRKSESILVAMQKPGDAAHGMGVDRLHKWAKDTVAYVKAVTGKPVTIRPHPMHDGGIPADVWGADRLSMPHEEALDDALRVAAGVVTYNSTVGWDAIIAGVPVVALASAGQCAYARYTTTLADLKPLAPKARTEALARVASTQWTLNELRDGSAVRETILMTAALVAA